MRKSFILLIIVSLISSVQTIPAKAIENGEAASGNSVVVPIQIQTTSTTWSSCSGALLAPNVVATAGHCVLDKSGLISSQILVGLPGSKNVVNSGWARAIQTYTDESYRGSDVNGMVTASDIAFLVLDKSFTQTTKLYLASENTLNALKASGAKLRIVGYGMTSDSGDQNSDPNLLDTTFLKTPVADPNQSLAGSSKGSICKGDSGSPVLSITPTRVTLIGVVTGAFLSVNCSKKQSDGLYVASFTAINRYANLSAEAITDAMARVQGQANAAKQATNDNEGLSFRVDALEQNLSDLQESYDAANQELEQLRTVVAAFKKTGLKVLVCTNLVSTKTIVAKSPVCPKGFKKE